LCGGIDWFFGDQAFLKIKGHEYDIHFVSTFTELMRLALKVTFENLGKEI